VGDACRFSASTRGPTSRNDAHGACRSQPSASVASLPQRHCRALLAGIAGACACHPWRRARSSFPWSTVAGAQEAAEFPVLVPDVQAARLTNLTHTWADDQRYVALIFAAGKVTITLAPTISCAEGTYRAQPTA